jgi:hypothetical protein
MRTCHNDRLELIVFRIGDLRRADIAGHNYHYASSVVPDRQGDHRARGKFAASVRGVKAQWAT